MIFIEAGLPGAYFIDIERLMDERGFFARAWCQREFTECGLDAQIVQCNISYNKHKGTLRGMHLQLPPFSEAKLMRCTRGAVYEVLIDLRYDSPSFLKWVSVELSADNRRAVFVPKGFAHGFQTLEDDTEVFYQMSEFYSPESGRGVRWNDPLFNIPWPLEVSVISEKDQNYADFLPENFPGLAMEMK